MNEQALERIDELLRFLPEFEAPDCQFVQEWKTETGQFPYPVYTAAVEEFFRLAGRPWWMDTSYQPNQAGKMLYDDAIVQAASLGEIKTMLTYCVRSERFGDGNWGGLLADGRIQALLCRLQTIRNEMAD